MFKLNIIRKALNLCQDLDLTKDYNDSNDSRIYYHFNPIITTDYTCYEKEIKENMQK